MWWAEITIGVILLAAFTLGIGAAWGAAAERKAWTLHAVTRDAPYATAHHCDGAFYYVIEEGVFVDEYQRRPTCPAPKNEFAKINELLRQIRDVKPVPAEEDVP